VSGPPRSHIFYPIGPRCRNAGLARRPCRRRGAWGMVNFPGRRGCESAARSSSRRLGSTRTRPGWRCRVAGPRRPSGVLAVSSAFSGSLIQPLSVGPVVVVGGGVEPPTYCFQKAWQVQASPPPAAWPGHTTCRLPWASRIDPRFHSRR
jgi:hypothetical protein